jgi:hypothetical protein
MIGNTFLDEHLVDSVQKSQRYTDIYCCDERIISLTCPRNARSQVGPPLGRHFLSTIWIPNGFIYLP